MNSRNHSRFANSIAALFAMVLGSGLGLVGTVNAQPVGSASATVSMFVPSGLNNPRGLKFGPDGYLYVAEGGTGVDDTNPAPLGDPGNCSTGINGPGQYFGSTMGSRISKIDVNGQRTTFVDNLPSSEAGGAVSGVADVAFIGDTMYALFAGAGCPHGVPSIPNQVIRVGVNGTTRTQVADLSAWLRAHPVANPTDAINGDFEPDGTWYSMIAVGGDLYAVEPNQGEVVKVTTSGKVSRLIDISAAYGHIVPTAIAYHGNFYVGNLDVFDPELPPGSSKIYKVTPNGQIKIDTNGLALVTGLVFDNRARMYVLELGTAPATFAPGTGQIVRVDPSGRLNVIVTGLSFPTGMTMGPDGSLYVSNFGFAFGLDTGQIVKVELTD